MRSMVDLSPDTQQARRPAGRSTWRSITNGYQMPNYDGAASPTGLDVGLATDVGRVREANEDALLALAPVGRGLVRYWSRSPTAWAATKLAKWPAPSPSRR